jgi:hypothetical protein
MILISETNNISRYETGSGAHVHGCTVNILLPGWQLHGSTPAVEGRSIL